MTHAAMDRERVLQTVRQWPLTEQIALVQEVLADLRRMVALEAEVGSVRKSGGEARVEPPPRTGSMHNLAGLLSTDQPPPTDEDVERWLDERRMDKYGRH